MSTQTNFSRRSFIKLAGAAGASLVLGFHLEGRAYGIARQTGSLEPNAYLVINADNTILMRIHRSEMGQGITTAIAMILADELEADWSQIQVEQAPPDRVYGDQVTGGSVSISGSYTVLRGAGAVARTMLTNAAAQTWEVDPAECRAELGTVIHEANGESLSYGDLVAVASTLAVPGRGEFTLKDPAEFRYIGTSRGNWHNAEIVTGAATYCSDVQLPDMLVASFERPPVLGARIESYEADAALAVEGVRHVVEVESGIAVAADDTWSAFEGRRALNAVWTAGATDLSSSAMRENLESRNDMSETAGVLKAQYHIPYQAHTTMEPMCCTVDIRADRAEVWTPTQDRQSALGAVRGKTGLSADAITLHVPLIGGAFGRRLQVDYVREACDIALAINTPVKLIWTREDDIKGDIFHPMSVSFVAADLTSTRVPSARTSGGSGVPTAAWRSVQNFTDAFPVESFVDELANATGQDPLDLRLIMHEGSQREAVIRLAAEKANWRDPLPEGWGRGMAVYSTFGVTHVAHVAEVEVAANGAIRVHRVVCAVDCGVVVNPDAVKAQMEGGIIFGLTAALKAGITVEHGAVQQSNFHDCPMLRFDETPEIEVHLVESDGSPRGVGEMGVPPIAPAVANAVFAATGIRVRHLPIQASDLV